MDIVCTLPTAYSILNYKRGRVDLRSHFHTGNPSHLCKTLLLDTYKALLSEKGTEHWKHPMLAEMAGDLQWNLCSDLCMSCFAIPTNNQILKKRSHLCISVLLRICDISQTYGFDKILLNICKHGFQRRNQFLFLLNIDKSCKRFTIAWFQMKVFSKHELLTSPRGTVFALTRASHFGYDAY